MLNCFIKYKFSSTKKCRKASRVYRDVHVKNVNNVRVQLCLTRDMINFRNETVKKAMHHLSLPSHPSSSTRKESKSATYDCLVCTVIIQPLLPYMGWPKRIGRVAEMPVPHSACKTCKKGLFAWSTDTLYRRQVTSCGTGPELGASVAASTTTFSVTQTTRCI